jgi:hypothetical protein
MSFSSFPFHHVDFAKDTSNEKRTNFTASSTVKQRLGLPTLLAAGAKALCSLLFLLDMFKV